MNELTSRVRVRLLKSVSGYRRRPLLLHLNHALARINITPLGRLFEPLLLDQFHVVIGVLVLRILFDRLLERRLGFIEFPHLKEKPRISNAGAIGGPSGSYLRN